MEVYTVLYLIFDSYELCYTANAVITLNMHLGEGITLVWSTPQERIDGKWVLEKPELEFMNNVIGYTDIQEYSQDWFNVVE